jgi:hypothetical protein
VGHNSVDFPGPGWSICRDPLLISATFWLQRSPLKGVGVMNGIQIERMLTMIDGSLDMTKDEVLRYIQSHEAEIVKELLENGEAWVPTSAGRVRIPISAVMDAVA